MTLYNFFLIFNLQFIQDHLNKNNYFNIVDYIFIYIELKSKYRFDLLFRFMVIL
jgi:hypothetical protein